MSVLSEGRTLGDWLQRELDPPNFCREEVTIASGSGVLVTGTVLGKVTATGKWMPFDDDGDDEETGIPGIGVAAAILVTDRVDATSADGAAVALVRGPAVVARQGLIWHENNDATDIDNGLADLAAMGLRMVVREAV